MGMRIRHPRYNHTAASLQHVVVIGYRDTRGNMSYLVALNQ